MNTRIYDVLSAKFATAIRVSTPRPRLLAFFRFRWRRGFYFAPEERHNHIRALYHIIVYVIAQRNHHGTAILTGFYDNDTARVNPYEPAIVFPSKFYVHIGRYLTRTVTVSQCPGCHCLTIIPFGPTTSTYRPFTHTCCAAGWTTTGGCETTTAGRGWDSAVPTIIPPINSGQNSGMR